MKNKAEQILSFAENELIDKESIRRAALHAAPAKQGKRVAWTKILLPIAASLVLLCGTVLAIPQARAEVFSWFHISRPADYLTADPSERPDVPELNALIASPDANEEVVTIPIDRTDSEAVNSEGALKVSQFLHENCDVALGEAMFDGERLFQTVRLNGLSGLYLLEQWTGSRTMAVPVDPYAVWGLYENGPEEEYLSGEKTLYEWPNAWIMYEMPDGTRLCGGSLDLTSSIEGHLDHLDEMGLLVENQTEEQQKAVDAENRAYLEENGLMAATEMYPQNYEQYLDADGNLTAKVYYIVKVIEEDRGDGNVVPDTELYSAQIGTITVNMKAYQSIKATGLTAEGVSVVWGDEAVTVFKESTLFGVDGTDKKQITFIKHRVSMEGVTMRAETETAEIDAFGIRKVGVRIHVPNTWTDAQKEALAASLEFDVLLNGERGEWYPQYVYCEVQDDGSILWKADEVYGIPYDFLKTVQTVTFLPMIRSTEKIEEYDADWNYLNTIEPAYGELAYGLLGASGWRESAATTDYPQYAITLHVN